MGVVQVLDSSDSLSSVNQATRRTKLLDEGDGGYALVFSNGAHAPLVLPDHGEVVVGREAPAVLLVRDDSVSRQHAKVHGGSPPELEDLGSTNGTKVMGRLLAAGERAKLGFGTVVELGSVVAFVQRAEGLDAHRNSPTAQSSSRMTIAPPAATFPPPRSDERSVVIADPEMVRLYRLIDVISPSRLSILVLGETGAGKDVYAETIHRRSPRARAPFMRINCAALPENLLEAELFGYERGAFTGALQAKLGLFEAADGGTVFLDEIGEMTLSTQAKLLRVLESGEVMRLGSVKSKRVDVRFVAATNRDLEALSQTGQFRSDLFFRLNGVSVTLPPLRRRPDDILPLAKTFLGPAANMLSTAAESALRNFRWPGNIRELKNVVERAALLSQGGAILPEHLLFSNVAVPADAPVPLPAPSAPSLPAATGQQGFKEELNEMERVRILEAMEKCGGNQSRAAKQLGISRTTLIKRLEQYQYVRPRKV